MLTVKQAAEVAGVSPHTVRYYDERGLVPGVVRDEVGGRLFDDGALQELKTAVALRESGLSIGDIRRYLDLCAAGSATEVERKALLRTQRARLSEKSAAIEEALRTIDSLLA